MDIGPGRPWAETAVDVVPEVERCEDRSPDHLGDGHGDEAEVSVGGEGGVGVLEVGGEGDASLDEVIEG